MGVLAHYFERAGFPTTQISLIRLHSERTRPPRALWVPFELGRPLGTPGDRALHKQVLKQALDLLVRDDGPVVLADYQTASGEPWLTRRATGWRPPFQHPIPGASDWRAELAALAPSAGAQERTTVGLSGLSMEDALSYIQRFATEEPLVIEREGTSDALLLRFAVDDVKAYYTEAAAADPAQTPSSYELGRWFWSETEGGHTVLAARKRCLAHGDKRSKLIAGSFIVPRLWIEELKLA